MKQYLELLERVMETGTSQSNRTGIDCTFVPGEMMKFDLTKGFPVITTRKAAWKSAMGEMMAFITGATNLATFHARKCKFWDANAAAPAWQNNPACLGEGDLGEIYGAQWRYWLREDGTAYDQFARAIDDIRNNPTSRRIVVSAWRPDRFDRMALPPCHIMFQFIVNVTTNELHLNMYIRSNDLFLGAPANIIEYAWLLEAVAHVTGYTAKWFTYFVGDAHIYANHFGVVSEQLKRKPHPLPTLKFLRPYVGDGDPLRWLETCHPDDFELVGYEHDEPLTAPMAV